MTDTLTGGGDFEASTLASSEHHLRVREIAALNARELPQLWKEVEFRRWENEQLRRQLAIVVLALWSACALRVEAGRVG